ncbi:TVP38/TMEM64 family protein [Paenibacillus sp. YYML68]|uniref:TVP38/TMEM64 family protein n=1 Tax=Paenibacillus sp. YYML68 TaxID=2909250 RepID=UPI002490528C|nr:TVP38/TMEM64 family protein [Paenibacillus sp. YYML68]
MNRNALLKLAAVATIVTLLLWFNHTYVRLTPSSIREWIVAWGWLAPFVYIVLYTVRPLILFPASILSLTGGLAFGLLGGTVLTVVGATMGAAVSFFVARKAGSGIVQMKGKGKFADVQKQLDRNGLLYVLLLRLIPLFPFDLISYAAGLSTLKFRVFLIGTFVGIIPGTFAYIWLGASLAGGSRTDIAIAAVVFLAALLIPLRFKKKLEGTPHESESI